MKPGATSPPRTQWRSSPDTSLGAALILPQAFRHFHIQFTHRGQRHAVITFGRGARNQTIQHIRAYAFGGPPEGITITAASGPFADEDISFPSRHMGYL